MRTRRSLDNCNEDKNELQDTDKDEGNEKRQKQLK